jgi:hypothetical protein
MRRRTYDRIVWEIVWQIPAGRVMTYGQIASMIPAPSGMDVPAYERIAPRWVGYAMRRCMTDANNQPPDATHPAFPGSGSSTARGRSVCRSAVPKPRSSASVWKLKAWCLIVQGGSICGVLAGRGRMPIGWQPAACSHRIPSNN